MSRAASRAKATAAAAPAKIDPAAPPPIADDVEARAKATRPTFRRGGLVFGDRDWTGLPAETDPAALAAILAEPVLILQVRTADGWRTLDMEERAALAASLPSDEPPADAPPADT
jgi:hypothetical protein